MKLVRVGWVALVGAVVCALGCGGGSPANAASSAAQASLVVPKPIPGGDFIPDLPHHRAGIIHQFFPVALPLGDGVWAEPNGITDFDGLVAQVFQGGTAVDSAGKQWIVDVDNRVYAGEYVGTDGRHAVGAFCEI